jgi:PAS domain S-box-containing protein
VSLDSLDVQLSSARQRLAALQRRLDGGTPGQRLFQQALEELEGAIESLRVAHDRLVEQNTELADLRTSVESERRKYWELFDSVPDACIVTGEDSRITAANRAAAELLNISQRFLVGKPLSVFVCEDRGRMLDEARQIAEHGGSAEIVVRIRPRERAPLQVAASLRASENDGCTLRWVLRRAGIPVPAVAEP